MGSQAPEIIDISRSDDEDATINPAQKSHSSQSAKGKFPQTSSKRRPGQISKRPNDGFVEQIDLESDHQPPGLRQPNVTHDQNGDGSSRASSSAKEPLVPQSTASKPASSHGSNNQIPGSQGLNGSRTHKRPIVIHDTDSSADDEQSPRTFAELNGKKRRKIGPEIGETIPVAPDGNPYASSNARSGSMLGGPRRRASGTDAQDLVIDLTGGDPSASSSDESQLGRSTSGQRSSFDTVLRHSPERRARGSQDVEPPDKVSSLEEKHRRALQKSQAVDKDDSTSTADRTTPRSVLAAHSSGSPLRSGKSITNSPRRKAKALDTRTSKPDRGSTIPESLPSSPQESDDAPTNGSPEMLGLAMSNDRLQHNESVHAPLQAGGALDKKNSQQMSMSNKLGASEARDASIEPPSNQSPQSNRASTRQSSEENSSDVQSKPARINGRKRRQHAGSQMPTHDNGQPAVSIPKRRQYPLSPSQTTTDDMTQSRDETPTVVEGNSRDNSEWAPDAGASHLPQSSKNDVSHTSKRLETVSAGSSTRILAEAVSNSPPTELNATVAMQESTQDLHEKVEQVVVRYVQEIRDDNEHWTQTTLRRARLSAQNRPKVNKDEPTTVFSRMKPLDVTKVLPRDKKATGQYAKFTVEDGRSTSTWTVPCQTFSTSVQDVPSYAHYVSIKNNFLAQNEPTLQHWPYFGDDFDVQEAAILQEKYTLDIDAREQKILQLARAENCYAYADEMLRELDCTWYDVLHFLLDPDPDVNKDGAATMAIGKRERYCSNEIRESTRWKNVLAELPKSRSQDVARAALLCDQFDRLRKVSMWQVAQTTDEVRALLAKGRQTPSVETLTCAVCMRIDCQCHGEIKEFPDDEEDESQDHVVLEDIVNPPDANHKKTIAFPAGVDDTTYSAPVKDQRAVDRWLHGDNAKLISDLSKRGPFYPCDHPGTSCEVAGCSCFEKELPCEKSCGCLDTCRRKFQGCNCIAQRSRNRQKLVCFNDDRCACFKLDRECDPDLCGECGVRDVLDPVHKHDEHVLSDACRNASLQRAVLMPTMLGDSRYGFGLYARKDIRKHDFVGEYTGEVISKGEGERRWAVYTYQELNYLFSLNKFQDLDATHFGNKTRFINHESEDKLNIVPKIMLVNAVHRIALYSTRHIKAGEELYYDYTNEFWKDHQLGCKQTMKATAPIRNANITRTVDDGEVSEDESGLKRARKVGNEPPRPRAPPRRSERRSSSATPKRPGQLARPRRNLSQKTATVHNQGSRSGRRRHGKQGAEESAATDYGSDFALYNTGEDNVGAGQAEEADDEEYVEEDDKEEDDKEEDDEDNDDEDLEVPDSESEVEPTGSPRRRRGRSSSSRLR